MRSRSTKRWSRRVGRGTAGRLVGWIVLKVGVDEAILLLPCGIVRSVATERVVWIVVVVAPFGLSGMLV